MGLVGVSNLSTDAADAADATDSADPAVLAMALRIVVKEAAAVVAEPKGMPCVEESSVVEAGCCCFEGGLRVRSMIAEGVATVVDSSESDSPASEPT